MFFFFLNLKLESFNLLAMVNLMGQYIRSRLAFQPRSLIWNYHQYILKYFFSVIIKRIELCMELPLDKTM